MVNNEDPDEMPHYAAFHQGLHFLLRYKQIFIKEVSTCDSLKHKMDYPVLILSTSE